MFLFSYFFYIFSSYSLCDFVAILFHIITCFINILLSAHFHSVFSQLPFFFVPSEAIVFFYTQSYQEVYTRVYTYLLFWLISSKFTPCWESDHTILPEWNHLPSLLYHILICFSLYSFSQNLLSPPSQSPDDFTSHLSDKTEAVERELLWTCAAMSLMCYKIAALLVCQLCENFDGPVNTDPI